MNKSYIVQTDFTTPAGQVDKAVLGVFVENKQNYSTADRLAQFEKALSAFKNTTLIEQPRENKQETLVNNKSIKQAWLY